MASRILTSLDVAKTQYYHFKAIVVAGMGLFTDAYDLFCMPPVMRLIGRLYYGPVDGKPGVIPPAVFSTIAAISLLGAVIGQLVFGRLGDMMGRQRVYGITLLLMVSSSIGCGFSICRTRACVLSSLCFFRFLIGVGVGGDYPLSATIMSEFANIKTRGAFIAAVFSMQGFGILVSSAITMAVLATFNHAKDRPVITSTTTIEEANSLWQHRHSEADLAWRIILMLGAVPAGLTFYWRMMMPETPRFTALVERDERRAAANMQPVMELEFDPNAEDAEEPPTVQRQQQIQQYGLFSRQFFRDNGKDLFACSIAWLLVDIVFYCSNLFQSQIYNPWFPVPEHVNAYEDAYNLAKFQAIIAIASTVPGYWFAVYFIDHIGRRKMQMMGFFFMGLFLFAIGGAYDSYWHNHTTAWFILLYALTFFFSNFGPNTTTFIVPAELFPARFRSTCHGISGAAGKVGAIIGSVGFFWASQKKNKDEVPHGYYPGIGMMNSLLILGGVCVVGVVFTYIFTPETNGKSLEENESRETQNGGEEKNGVHLRRDTSNTSRLSSMPLNQHSTPSNGVL